MYISSRELVDDASIGAGRGVAQPSIAVAMSAAGKLADARRAVATRDPLAMYDFSTQISSGLYKRLDHTRTNYLLATRVGGVGLFEKLVWQSGAGTAAKFDLIEWPLVWCGGWCFRLASETVKMPGWRGQWPHLLSFERQTSIESPHHTAKRR